MTPRERAEAASREAFNAALNQVVAAAAFERLLVLHVQAKKTCDLCIEHLTALSRRAGASSSAWSDLLADRVRCDKPLPGDPLPPGHFYR